MLASFDLKDVLQAVGPTASLIFAAWIFLSYLQQRYSSSYERYRALIDEFRHHPEKDQRHASLLEQILEYKRRCQQMRLATHIGLLAAIILISSIIFAALNMIDDDIAAFKFLSAGLAILGLLLVIWAAILVILENLRLQLIIDSDLSDVPELEQAAHDPRRIGARKERA
jgi:hypothetical protein